MQELTYSHPWARWCPGRREHDPGHKVYVADFVTAENTGCVHMAPGHGLEDYELGMKNHMEIFLPGWRRRALHC